MQSDYCQCHECDDPNPSRRRYHWLSIPSRELEGHLSWIQDKNLKTNLVQDLLTTRSRYGDVVTDRGIRLEPCDAWKSAMIAAQNDKDAPFDDYRREWEMTYTKVAGETRSQYLRRVMESREGFEVLSGLIKAAEAHENRINDNLYDEL